MLRQTRAARVRVRVLRETPSTSTIPEYYVHHWQRVPVCVDRVVWERTCRWVVKREKTSWKETRIRQLCRVICVNIRRNVLAACRHASADSVITNFYDISSVIIRVP